MEQFIILPQGTSSSTIIAEMHNSSPLESGTTLMLLNQTAGHGQRGNSWEAEPSQNVTQSILLLHDKFPAADQFVISQLISLAIIDLLREEMSWVVKPERISVKWPNDIYVDNSKIAGILIENTVTGTLVERSIAGIGLNVNQIEFVSDAPNPVSIAQITGRVYEAGAEHLGRQLSRRIIEMFKDYSAGRLGRDDVMTRYRESLWRGAGHHPFTDMATNETFYATITDIEPNGLMHLVGEDGKERVYAFKEVAFAAEDDSIECI